MPFTCYLVENLPWSGNESTVVCPYNRIIFGGKKEQIPAPTEPCLRGAATGEGRGGKEQKQVRQTGL